jgi:hypothetical protein
MDGFPKEKKMSCFVNRAKCSPSPDLDSDQDVMESLLTDVNGPSPEREASFFYGLFLRGHSLDDLRKDIDVSNDVVSHWEKMRNLDTWYREALDVMLPFRKRVLAIFDSQIRSDKHAGQVKDRE